MIFLHMETCMHHRKSYNYTRKFYVFVHENENNEYYGMRLLIQCAMKSNYTSIFDQWMANISNCVH